MTGTEYAVLQQMSFIVIFASIILFLMEHILSSPVYDQ
jgi:hypothetical protein